MDDLYEYEAGVVILAAQVQEALREALRDNTRVATLHTPAYTCSPTPGR